MDAACDVEVEVGPGVVVDEEAGSFLVRGDEYGTGGLRRSQRIGILDCTEFREVDGGPAGGYVCAEAQLQMVVDGSGDFDARAIGSDLCSDAEGVERLCLTEGGGESEECRQDDDFTHCF